MKKVLCIIGSEQKRSTYHSVQGFEKTLKEKAVIDFEYLFLKDYHLEFCCGCKLCFDKGEHLCPYKDDCDLLISKIDEADGVLLAVPNYAFQVPGRVKNFLDRMAFMLHRPRFFHKSFTVIVTQGIFGGAQIQKYLEDIAGILGFEVLPGVCINTLEPMSDLQNKKNEHAVTELACRFARHLERKRPISPTLYRLMMFRMQRSGIKQLDDTYCDYRHFKGQGWFESDYYFGVSLNSIKRVLGRAFDGIGYLIGKNMKHDK